MMRPFQIIIPSFIMFILCSFSTMAQENLLSEVDVNWKYEPNPEGKWSYEFGSVYRSTFYSEGEFDFSTNFLQLSIAPVFEINSHHEVSLEVRYRIKELFDSKLTDEKRIVEQYSHSHKINKVKLKGRFRLEQRFRKKFNWRNRYKLAATIFLNENTNSLKRWSFTVETEALWSITPLKSPSFDQRSSVVLAKPISKKIVLKLKPEYRYLDYTHDGEGIWNIYGIVSLSL